MDDGPTTAAGAGCFFHGEQQRAVISWLLAFGASGCDQRFRSTAVGRGGDEDAGGSTASPPTSQAVWTGKQDGDIPADSVRIRNSQAGAPASKLHSIIHGLCDEGQISQTRTLGLKLTHITRSWHEDAEAKIAMLQNSLKNSSTPLFQYKLRRLHHHVLFIVLQPFTPNWISSRHVTAMQPDGRT